MCTTIETLTCHARRKICRVPITLFFVQHIGTGVLRVYRTYKIYALAIHTKCVRVRLSAVRTEC